MSKQNKTNENLAYIAGLFDGEGHISIPISKKRGYSPSYWLQIGITNRKKMVLDYVQKTLGVGHINIDKRKNNSTKARVCYRWIANSQQAKRILEALFPYLKIKKEQAKLAIKFQSSIRIRPSRYDKLLEAEINERQKIKEKLEELNAK